MLILENVCQLSNLFDNMLNQLCTYFNLCPGVCSSGRLGCAATTIYSPSPQEGTKHVLLLLLHSLGFDVI